MTKFKSLLIILGIASVFVFTACAKKNSSFASRYAKNGVGANVVNGEKTQQAAEQAAASGLIADVVDIQRQWLAPVEQGLRVTSMILINNQQMPVVTTHKATEVVQGRVDVSGYTVVFHAMCANEACNPYYAALEVYQGTVLKIQEGVRKYFDGANAADLDSYQWFNAKDALPFMGANVTDTAGMVGFLNQGASVSTSSEIIK